MTNRRVVIGASAGGVEALKELVSRLPADFRGSLFVVLHIGANRSNLPGILSSAGFLPAVHPTDSEQIKPGTIYVAPPDQHMLLLDTDRIRLSRGPRENHTRPAINPLFRSAAASFGPSVTGIILSGNLDDGVLGLAEIKRKGGMAIVQEPKTALFPSMPKCAIASVPIDFVVPVEKMPPLLSVTPFAKSAAAEVGLNMEEYSSKLTCPECHGPISEFRAGNLIEYRCRVGHSYSPLTFAQDHRNMLERKLWEAVLALEESADIADGLNLQLGGPYSQEAHDRRKQASMVKSILDNLNVSSDPIDQAS